MLHIYDQWVRVLFVSTILLKLARRPLWFQRWKFYCCSGESAQSDQTAVGSVQMQSKSPCQVSMGHLWSSEICSFSSPVSVLCPGVFVVIGDRLDTACQTLAHLWTLLLHSCLSNQFISIGNP